MAMSSSQRGINADMNVTPMIDILLVLLIIFMIITPSEGLKVIIPQPSKDEHEIPPDAIVVIQLSARGSGAGEHPSVKLNQQPVAWSELPERLAKVFLTRSNKSAFLKADSELDFQEVASVIDIAHDACWADVGLLTT